MKRKKVLALALASTMLVAMMGCGNTSESNNSGASENEGAADLTSYEDIILGEDFTDLEATITMFNNRTDLDSDDYGGVTWKEYLAAFNEVYPNITVKITTDTNYADDALTHLQSGDYETIMGIPAIDSADFSTYFISYGDLETMSKQINYADEKMYQQEVYGVPFTATTQGIVYNKKVFADAGITETPKTPDEFIDALKQIKENTDAIPLYTNYAAGWTMGVWDMYTGVSATGDEEYANQKLLHTKDPFKDYGDNTHPYSVYKILYDAVAEGLTEDDYTTTDWEGCKGMMNNGEIACMVLGSWAVPQMKAAGPNVDDIGYMAFPITIDGKQYAKAGADYCFGINVNAPTDEQQAALVFVKWMAEESGYSYNEDGLPVATKNTETKLSFDGVDFIDDAPSIDGEEDLLNELNAESELNVNNGGDRKIQELIEHASIGDMTFDEIMDSWNQLWTDAQDVCGAEIQY
ncbi:ABC transporter substrate-binding protein [Pseudobutyrivibrio xylanivorans]|uniref:Carbohydrate ABC transporter substrate-binding protein, CUT1 family (TC 3.A.1.1.-) n=2 Tax=Pseudobutyrivibrio xylanivorans TaxID=185007 RepID=A0A1M6A329_PSEXY|nr:extracellular solute-binding protein [Pseudobutyrivibrio xylanivorans]SCZ76854.1 ABC-type glycerol-3-phosphate transport system, substrate-binding protein [Pseudobutyrivibrio xylanivorans]SHI30890.1 carbohydrate ABC transporter substrate-binding protein, CUT1 family (TC 3.A.1.1.-) [Pseudobutyrivibrio xylanivorans DSM 14809]